MIRGIYKVRIQSFVKDMFHFNQKSNLALTSLDGLNASIKNVTDEIEEIAISIDFTPHEKTRLIEERLVKIEDLGNKVTDLLSDLKHTKDEILKEKKILIETFLENNPESTEEEILSEIDNELKKLL